jgi:hypothetical protein
MVRIRGYEVKWRQTDGKEDVAVLLWSRGEIEGVAW